MATSVIRIKKSVHGVGRSLRLKNSQLNSALTIAHPMPIRIRKGRKKNSVPKQLHKEANKKGGGEHWKRRVSLTPSGTRD